MARKVFVSFRYADGHLYKERLEKIFSEKDDIINCSESQDRSGMSEETIKNYLYNKLRNTSVTIVLLTPQAIEYKKDQFGIIDDWIYDEVRYSLDDRENNRCNGLVAVYTPEAKDMVIEEQEGLILLKDFDNLVRNNMHNVKEAYKKCEKRGIYDKDYDSYCSLIPWNNFISNPNFYIEKAIEKREKKEQYELKKRMNDNELL